MYPPMGRLLWCLAGLLTWATTTQAQDLVAKLDYGTFQGAYSAQYNISYWGKIPFGAPPVGPNRFRAPQPPLSLPAGTVFNSTQPFDMCPQRSTNGSEDCLYLSLYSRPWTAGQPLRPVVVVFHGGGFIQGGGSGSARNPFPLPPSAYPVLNVSAAVDLVFVYPNYRLNAFGFLPGRQLAADDALNPGLLDQAAAIRWAARHAVHFGGDAAQITVWGQSAGAGAVVAQALADPAGGGATFARALASSPFWPKTYRPDDPPAQALYDTLADRTGCTGGGGGPVSDAAGLACLRRVDVQALREAALELTGSQTYTTSSYTWAPVVDGRFLRAALTAATGVGPRVAWGMYNTHEGENFVPTGLQGARSSGTPPFNSSAAGFGAWLRGFLPGLGGGEVEGVEGLYPERGSAEALGGYADAYTRAGLIYRDVVLACPAYWLAGAAEGQGGGGWLGEYSMNPSKHASDTSWWNSVNAVQKTDPLHYRGYTGALASFFMTGDPNAMKLTEPTVPGVPPLKSGKEFNVNSDGFTNLELTQFKKRCDFWKAIGPKVPV